MSENKEYFKFGTRYPYLVGAKDSETWVQKLKETGSAQTKEIWEYGNNTFKDSQNNDEITLSVDAYGDDINFKSVKTIINRFNETRESTEPLVEKIYFGYTNSNNVFIPNETSATKLGKSSSGRYCATSLSESAGAGKEPASANSMKFFANSLNGTNITSRIKKIIDELVVKPNEGFSSPNIAQVEATGLTKSSNPYMRYNGEGKYLDLRVIYGMSVNEILNILSTNRKRKDLLFYKAQDWKEKISGIDINNLGFGVQLTESLDNISNEGDVTNGIKLIPENFVFKSGFKYDLGLSSEVTNSGPFKVINNLAGGAAMLDAIVKKAKDNSGNEEISFSERIDRFRNVPYVKDVENNCIDSLTFKFHYGQFGKFNCLEEVVKPILKLASLFSYEFNSYDGKNGEKNYVAAPFEPKFNVMTKMYNSLFQSGIALVNQTMGEKKDENGKKIENKPSVSTLSKIPRMISNVVNKAAGEAKVTVFLFSIGSSIYGPFYVSDVKWEFEYERTNGNGLPFAGSINFSGIKPLIVEDNLGLLSTGGQIIGEKNSEQ